MKYFFIGLLGLVSTHSFSQNYNTIYANPFLELGSSSGLSIHLLDDTLFIFGGIAVQNTGGTGNNLLLKYDLEGNFISEKLWDPLHEDLSANLGRWGGVGLYNEQDSTFFSIAYSEYLNFQELDSENDNILILNRFGDEVLRNELEWQPFGKNLFGAKSINSDEHLIYGGAWDSEGAGSLTDTGFLLNCNSLGETNWVHRYDSIAEIRFMSTLPEDGYLLGASIFWSVNGGGNNNFYDQVILKTNNLGEEQWRYIFGGTEGESYAPVTMHSDGTIITLGVDALPGQGPEDGPLWFQRIQDNGDSYEVLDELLWDNPGGYEHIPYGVKEVNDGGIVGYGYGKPPWDDAIGDVPPSGFIYKVDENLDSLWKRYYKHFTTEVDSHHAFHDMVEGPDSCFYLTGQASRGEGTGVFGLGHVWLVKLDQYGCLEPGCHLIEDTIDNVVQIIGLQNSLTVFPNPVKDNFTLEVSLPLEFSPPAHSVIKIIDINGREVKQVPLDNIGHQHSERINIQELSVGTYTLHWMNTGLWYDSVKIIVNGDF